MKTGVRFLFLVVLSLSGLSLAAAKHSLEEPITRIGHLDKDDTEELIASETGQNDKNQILERIGNGIVWKNPPQKESLQKNLTPAEMAENFEILVKAIDRYFSFFIHKGIEWDSVCQRYREKLHQTKTTQQFYQLVYEFIRELKDAHSWLQDYEAASTLDTYAPPISIRRIEGKPVVIDVWKTSKAYREGVRPGWILVSVNRRPVDRYLEFLGDHVSMSSSERNLLEKTTRMILCGKRDSLVKPDFLSTEGKLIRGIELARSVRYPETEPKLPFGLTKFKTIWYGTHSSGYGYICILTFKGQMEIADEFDKALESLRNTKGLIIDIRDNPGGSGICQRRIIGRFLTEKAPGTVNYQRNGPKHADFMENKTFLTPCGDWQYKNPVGLLMNSLTGSASDLFAARFVSTGRVITMGQTTHGNVTGVGVYVHLPCNLVVRVSNGYIADASGRIIEGNGTEPQVRIEPKIEDARQQIDGVLERAFMELEKRCNRTM